MAGHSKWANIQHRKGAQDKRRAKAYNKLIRELTIVARMSGSDPGASPRLRLAIDKARAQNMPKDTIDRAIARGAGELDGVAYQDVTYEGYGPGGVAVIVECTTDNRNRTVAEVRQAFTRYGGNMGADGSVGYLFNRVGLLTFPRDTSEDPLTGAAIDAGAEDVIVNEDGSLDVLTDPADFAGVRKILESNGFTADIAQITMRSAVNAPLDEAGAAQMLKLVETLEDLDDVQNVYSNAAIPEDVLSRL